MLWDMSFDRDKLIQRAKTATRELKSLDFKREFDPDSGGCWCELVKDIVAFANSGGGVILFGVLDDGAPSDFSADKLLKYDSSNFTTQAAKYTGHQLSDIEVIEIDRAGHICAALLVGAVDVPLVFVKPGTYEVTLNNGKAQQKNAFSVGTIYFRHNSKSEPGNRDDLTTWRDAEIEKHRQTWLTGIRKVVAFGANEAITVVAANGIPPDGTVSAVIATNDPTMPRFFPKNAGEVWPLRQKELIEEVNKRLPPGHKMTSHDMTCLKGMFNLLEAHPELACKPHKLASPQYGKALVDFIIDEHQRDPTLFHRAREHYLAAHSGASKHADSLALDKRPRAIADAEG